MLKPGGGGVISQNALQLDLYKQVQAFSTMHDVYIWQPAWHSGILQGIHSQKVLNPWDISQIVHLPGPPPPPPPPHEEKDGQKLHYARHMHYAHARGKN